MITAEQVQVIFKQGSFKPAIRALDGFSLSIEKGDVFGLLGPNGAGKSTAMYCFLGLIKPDRGHVTIWGQNPDPGSAMYEKIAYVPEEPQYHLDLTVAEAVRYYAALYNRHVPQPRINEAIERVGLGGFRDLRLEKCSKGMKQKAGLAVCLLNDPELVFLDEPTRGLDPVAVKEFRDIILAMNKQGTTFVINSHILSEVEMVCNRVAIMDRGRVVVDDRMQHLLKYDLENYTVETDVPSQIPAYVLEPAAEGGRMKGIVPAGSIGDFLAMVRDQNLKLYECSLKKLTLEEAFFSILREGTKNE